MLGVGFSKNSFPEVVTMMVRNATFSLVVAVCMAGGAVAADTDLNLFTQSTVETVVLVAPDQPDDLERYALAELARHVEKTTGTEPKLFKSADIEGGGLPADSNVVILGRTDDNPDLKDLAEIILEWLDCIDPGSEDCNHPWI